MFLVSGIEDRRKTMEVERNQLLKEINSLKQEKVDKHSRRIQNQVEYSSDLKDQISFQKEMKQYEQASNQLEIELAKVINQLNSISPPFI
jgi:seryl-tRNA synthetase